MHACSRWCGLAAMVSLLVILARMPAVEAQASDYTVMSREGAQQLPTRMVGGQEMFALDDLARLFDLTVREDTLAGGLTVSTKTQTIVLTPGQALASVAGRLISLPAPPARDGRSWFVPVDFVARALAPALGSRVELRKPSRLILTGEVRVPRVAGAIAPQGTLARLTLDVAPATPHSVSQDGARLLIRFEADALDASLPVSTTPELISAVRRAEGAPMLVVDLGPRFGSFRSSELPGERGATRIIVDVLALTSPTPEPPPGAPGAAAPPMPDPPPLLDLAPPGGLRTVVIDAGHGGEEEGARGPDGTLEKDVTLSVAKRLKAALESRLGLRVILTRDSDQTVGLDERAAVANNNKADLFISLHANASLRPAASGAEVFYLSLAEYGDQAERVARGESEALPVFGGGTRDIEVILWEMAQARYIEQSALLAQAIEAALREHVPMSPRAIQQAPFRVLVGANMPAVLVEMAFITNPDQERQLKSDTFQTSLVRALVDSVGRFRDGRSTESSTPAPATNRARGPGAPR